jgi:hypothetical protein
VGMAVIKKSKGVGEEEEVAQTMYTHVSKCKSEKIKKKIKRGLEEWLKQ